MYENQESFGTDNIEGVSVGIVGTPKNLSIINIYNAKEEIGDEDIQEIKDRLNQPR